MDLDLAVERQCSAERPDSLKIYPKSEYLLNLTTTMEAIPHWPGSVAPVPEADLAVFYLSPAEGVARVQFPTLLPSHSALFSHQEQLAVARCLDQAEDKPLWRTVGVADLEQGGGQSD